MNMWPMLGLEPPAPPPAVETVPPGMSAAPMPSAPTFEPRPPSRPGRDARRWASIAIAVSIVVAAATAQRWLWPHAAARMIVVPADLSVDLTGPATLDALVKSSVGPRTQGTIATMAVDRGDSVRTGDVIATLDAADLAQQLASAEATAAAAASAVRLARADRDRSASSLATAKRNRDRQEALFARSFATQAVRDDARAAVTQGEADLARADAAVDQAEAQAAAAAATVALQRVRLEDATLRAPIDGVVVSRSRWVGDGVGPGSEIIALADPASIVFSVRLDESTIARLDTHQPATVRTAGAEADPIAAEVLRIGRSVDTETREFTVEVKPSRLPGNWAIGQRATVTITVETRLRVLAIPANAIVWRDGRPTVWVATDGRAQRRELVLGAVGGALVEVRDGLRPGDVVLTEPGAVYPAMPIHAVEAMP